ncbi:MAG TPA: 3-phosphoshikimate 1-carboxyvinyltransferase [Candidatus Tumulicola sp.]|jgi:3-phosphoshikimate 1-carboxyvinyltransferase
MLGSRTFAPGPLRGELAVPGDKSVSHRALMVAASVGNPIAISHLNPGHDVRATLEALRALGVQIDRNGTGAVVTGSELQPSRAPIDCMNSGSTARMLLGVCAGANVPVALDGDASLRQRPMEPVAAQLRAFGARIETSAGCLPLDFRGRGAVETRSFILLAPSAQVKSALLLAALYARTPIAIAGDRGSRDHTERLLGHLDADIRWNGRSVAFSPRPLRPLNLEIVGDFSSAAFFITAAAITPGSAILVRDVGVNPTRTGLLEALRTMGARIEERNARDCAGEPMADIAVESTPLRAAHIDADLALRAIDEIPLLALAAAFADGETRIAGSGDLRTKESDRIAAIERLLGAVGIAATHESGELRIRGGRPAPCGTPVETHGDHRIAMATAVLARAAGPLAVDETQSAGVSFPGFFETLERV